MKIQKEIFIFFIKLRHIFHQFIPNVYLYLKINRINLNLKF